MKIVTGSVILLVAFLVTGAVAQVSDGDVVLVANGPLPNLLGVHAVPHGGGSHTTLFGTFAFTGVGGLAAAPGNNGILFTCLPFTVAGGTVHILHLDRSAVVSTLFVLPGAFRFVPTTIVDQRGDLLLLNNSPDAVEGGIYRWSPASKTLTTLANDLPGASAMTEDLLTGELIVGTVTGDVYRIARSGQVVSIHRGALPAFVNLRGKFDSHLADSSVLAAWGALLRYNPRTGVTTTLPPLIPGGSAVGLDYNPIHGDHYVTQSTHLWQCNISAGRGVQLWWYFPQPHVYPSDVVTWGSRMLTGAGIPTPGAIYRIRLVIPSEPGRPYLAGASLGTLRGIPTTAGRIPLDPDVLLVLSRTNPAIFRGFSGLLDTTGSATLTLAIPPVRALRGLRFFVAALTYGPAGVRRITEPLGVLVE